MACRRLPVFRSDMERRSAVMSLFVAVPDVNKRRLFCKSFNRMIPCVVARQATETNT
jgi:hypothetical protein